LALSLSLIRLGFERLLLNDFRIEGDHGERPHDVIIGIPAENSNRTLASMPLRLSP